MTMFLLGFLTYPVLRRVWKLLVLIYNCGDDIYWWTHTTPDVRQHK